MTASWPCPGSRRTPVASPRTRWRAGATLIVSEGTFLDVAAPQILVPSARRALSRLAALYYGRPSHRLTLVGITGTNGKTTTSYLVEALLRARGLGTGVIGTIQYVIGDERRPAGQTTPEALDIEAMLARDARRWAWGASSWRCPRTPSSLERAAGARLRRGSLHEPDAGPSRFSRNPRGIRARQAAPVRAARRFAQAPPHGGGERGRPGRTGHGRGLPLTRCSASVSAPDARRARPSSIARPSTASA